MFLWHVEATRSEARSVGAIHYGGLPAFTQKQLCHDERRIVKREETGDGWIEWTDDKDEMIRFRRPVWLDGLTRYATDGEA